MFKPLTSAGAAALAGCMVFALTASAQATPLLNPFTIGISGGVAVPTGDFAMGTSSGFPGVNTGYNVTGSLGVGLPVLPFLLRGDVSYNGFNGKYVPPSPNANGINPYADVRVVDVTADVIVPFHLPVPAAMLRPYLMGGIGEYNVRFSPKTGPSIASSNSGFNVGAGVKIPLVAFDAFIEARYHRVNQGNGSLAFVPVTVGVMF